MLSTLTVSMRSHRCLAASQSLSISSHRPTLSPSRLMQSPQERFRSKQLTKLLFYPLTPLVPHLRSLYHSLLLLHLNKVHVLYLHQQVACLPLFHLVLYLVKLYLLLIHSVPRALIRPHKHLYHSFLVPLARPTRAQILSVQRMPALSWSLLIK